MNENEEDGEIGTTIPHIMMAIKAAAALASDLSIKGLSTDGSWAAFSKEIYNDERGCAIKKDPGLNYCNIAQMVFEIHQLIQLFYSMEFFNIALSLSQIQP